MGSEVGPLGWGSATSLRITFITFRLKSFIWFWHHGEPVFFYYFKAILCCFLFLSGHPMTLVFQQNHLSVDLNMMICLISWLKKKKNQTQVILKLVIDVLQTSGFSCFIRRGRWAFKITKPKPKPHNRIIPNFLQIPSITSITETTVCSRPIHSQ